MDGGISPIATVPDRLRLPLRFPADRMSAEVQALPAETWTPHFNTAIYQGDWSGAALRSPGGATGQLYTAPMEVEFADSPLLRSCAVLQEALGAIRCPTTSVRLLRLGPGAVLREHRDFWLAFGDGQVRLHVPILTNGGVSFFLDGVPVVMEAGECWYLNLNLPHRAANASPEPRIHLVVDCVVDDWLRDLVEQAVRTGRRGS